MKGFVFTLDAIFSIVFAAAAISALVYVSYSSYAPPSIQSSQASSAGAALLAANLGGLGQGSPLYGAGSTGTWPQYGADEGFSFGSAYGPGGPYLLYAYQASANIIPAPVAAGGYVAFAAGNQLYEINATTGAPANNYPIQNSNAIVSSPVFYRNLLIFANSSGYVGAVSASNGQAMAWKTNIGYSRMTTPLEMEGGYLVFGIRNSSGHGMVYFMDPANGTVMEKDPTAVGGGALVSWIAHHRGGYYVGAGAGTVNDLLRGDSVNVSGYPSNGFASYGSFAALDGQGTASMYAGLMAYYNRISGMINITSVPYYTYAHRASFQEAPALFNTTPSLGGNTTYLLYNGVDFQAFRQGGMLFNVILPGSAALGYNYSDIALAYGNAYLVQGRSLYAFGAGAAGPQNSSLLSALAGLYLSGRGGLADYVLYNAYGAGDIGVFINGTYAPALHVAKFNGVDSYMTVPNSTGLNGWSAQTVSLWVKANPGMAQFARLVEKGANSEWTIIFNSAAGSNRVSLQTIGSAGICITTANSVADGTWHNIVAQFNRTSGAEAVYVDSQLSNSLTCPPTPLPENGNIYIGTYGGAPGGYLYNGLMADLQVYNTILPPSRVLGLYSSGMYAEPGNLSGLEGWWPLLGDGNDYGSGGHVAFPSNVMYANSGLLPASIGRAVQVGGSVLPLQLTSNGISRVYNVSVVVWSG